MPAKKQSELPKRALEEIRLPPEPWMPVEWQPADVMAIKGLADGTASKDQQQRALQFIITNVCQTYDQPYRGGEDGRRNTDFACGKRSVGLELVKFVNLPREIVQRRVKENELERDSKTIASASKRVGRRR